MVRVEHEEWEVTRPEVPSMVGRHGAFRCSECHALSIALESRPRSNSYVGPIDRQGTDHLVWFPLSPIGKDFPDVPEHIASAAQEATKCRSIVALRAAILLARSVIEATAKDKGITSGKLAQKIDEMAEKQLIRERIKEAAHEIRYLGNDMAHGDFVDAVDEEDADLILTLMEHVLRDVYQEPAQLDRARAARKAKKQGTE